MNLAELRKKAQKAKVVDEQPAVTPQEMLLPEESPAEAAVLVQPPALGSGARSGEAEPEIEPAAFRRLPEKSFDPVAILLAGREAALIEETAITDSAAAGTGTEEFQELLCFRVSAETYAINILAIKEIIKPREITEVPRAPSFVSGVLSLRGIIIPVFNMRLRLGLPVVEECAKERIIVLKKSEDFLGIIVDEVTRVVRVASVTIEKPPAVLDGVDRDFVSGIGRFDGEMLILLNLDKILDLTLM